MIICNAVLFIALLMVGIAYCIIRSRYSLLYYRQSRIVVHVQRDMNYNSRLTTITHTLTGHELQFEINSNRLHTHVTVIVVYLEL
jgi:hypothetical protein